MPRKKAGHTFVLVEFPDALLEAAKAQAGQRSLIAYLCGLVAADAGAEYVPAAKGRPKANTPGDATSGGRATAKRSGRKPRAG